MHVWMALGSGDAAHWDYAAAAFKAAHRDIDKLIAETRDPTRRDVARQFGERVRGFEEALNGLRRFGGSNPQITTPEGKAVFANALAQGKVMTDLGDGLAKAYDAAADAQLKTSTQQTAAFLIAIALTALASIAAGLTLSAAVARSINKPIKALTSTMGALAGGDLSVEVPGAEGRDEVSEMARAVEVFKVNALHTRELEAQALTERARSEEERRKAEAAAISQQQQLVIGSFGAGLKKLTDGDLTYRVTQPLPEVYEPLRADFNGAMDTLRETMTVVTTNAGAIRSGTHEISSAADDLSGRTEQQAASLEETAAALDEITATVKRTADGADEARRAVGSAKADAEHSSQVVRQAVAAMGQIETSSRQITQIIGVIDEIAFQTNLLALNAGVEAARAGEAGRGFAVVAQEVRALAQRSAEAAKEIKTLISASSQHVGQGVALVDETGEALERISTQVAKINGLVVDIASSAQEQATGLQQVNVAVNQMDQVTQQNAAMVEESTAAAHALAREAIQLTDLISRFEVGQTNGPSGRLELAQPGRHAPGPNPVAQARRKLAGFAGAGAAQAAESWAEF